MPVLPAVLGLTGIRRVIPIAQRRTHHGLAISLLSLDEYRAGCELRILCVTSQAAPLPDQHLVRLESLTLDVVDDVGTHYHVQQHSTAISAYTTHRVVRGGWYMDRPLDPRAARLRIQIAEVRWSPPYFRTAPPRTAENEALPGVPGEVIRGPWVFRVRW
jgi:hypothetical protein